MFCLLKVCFVCEKYVLCVKSTFLSEKYVLCVKSMSGLQGVGIRVVPFRWRQICVWEEGRG